MFKEDNTWAIASGRIQGFFVGLVINKSTSPSSKKLRLGLLCLDSGGEDESGGFCPGRSSERRGEASNFREGLSAMNVIKCVKIQT